MVTLHRSEERFSRNAETDLVCRLLLEKKKKKKDNGDDADIRDGDVRSGLHVTPPFYELAPLLPASFFFSCYRDHRDLHSFPTRRSSDLFHQHHSQMPRD